MNPEKSTQYVKTLGLNTTTIYDDETYFFLFADIDTKDSSMLEKVLNIFNNHHLSCYHYETSKGYHVISPCLLHVRLWLKFQKDLSFLDYRFDTIRISKRFDDKPDLYFNHFNKHFRHLESKSFHNLIRNIYRYSEIEPNENYINTSLSFTQYMQLKLQPLDASSGRLPSCRNLNHSYGMELNSEIENYMYSIGDFP
tara:strand:- start:457 stop:1047 length:591 start_codon:yes stop_codon:yes gene_type:complete